MNLSLTARLLATGCGFIGAGIGAMAACAVRRVQALHLGASGFSAWRGTDVWTHAIPGHSAAFTALQPLWHLIVQCALMADLAGLLLFVVCLPQVGSGRRWLYGLAALLALCVPAGVLMEGPSTVLTVDLDQRVVTGGDLGMPVAYAGSLAVAANCQSHYQAGAGWTLCYVTADTGSGQITLLTLGGIWQRGQRVQTQEIADGIKNFINSGGTTLQ